MSSDIDKSKKKKEKQKSAASPLNLILLLDHFRVPNSLTFKTRLSAKRFL